MNLPALQGARCRLALSSWEPICVGSPQNGGLWRDDDGRRNSISQNIEESFGVKPSDLPGAVALETVPGDVSDRSCAWLDSPASQDASRIILKEASYVADAAAN